MNGRTVGWVLTFVAFLALIALFSSPSRSPRDPAGPDGTLALRRLLAASGHSVVESSEPPIRGTFVQLADTGGGLDRVLRWVRDDGGRLVLADPRAAISSSLAAEPAGRIGGIFGTIRLSPSCADSAFDDVFGVVVRVTDAGLAAERPGAIECFPGRAGPFVLVVPHGTGTIVLLGGTSPLTNDLLRRADNAAFALALVKAGDPVVFGPSPAEGDRLAGGGSEVRPAGIAGIWSLLPTRAKVAVVGLGLAAVAFVLVRGRRLGRPRPEATLSSIPASELVRATAGLYRTGRKTAFAGKLMREGASAKLARRLGLPPGTEPERVAEAAGRAAGADARRLRDTLAGPEPSGDAELIDLGRELARIQRGLAGSSG